LNLSLFSYSPDEELQKKDADILDYTWYKRRKRGNGQEKLTLYVEEEIGKLARKIANLSGNSISALVTQYLLKRAEIKHHRINDSIKKWIGVLDTKKTYKAMRDDIVTELITRNKKDFPHLGLRVLSPIY